MSLAVLQLQHCQDRLKSARVAPAVQLHPWHNNSATGGAEMPECVVIIEFDPLVRDLLAEWLEDAGLRVRRHECGKPPPAPLADIRVVVVDLVNLRHGGRTAVGRVRSVFPGIPLLGLSTQARDGLAADCDAALELGLDMLLPKPCKRTTLLAAVRELSRGH